jgi:F420-non-reducing hydrogenase large subunit
MSVRQAAQGLIRKGQVITEGLLNRIEMAFRAYDPCFGCATHAVGQMPLEVRIYDADGSLTQVISRA